MLAFAADASEKAEKIGASLTNLFPIIAVFVIFYLLVIRPQQKKMKEQKFMLDSIKTGDQIMTSGGIIATVKKIDTTDASIILAEIAKDTVIKITRESIIKKLSNKVSEKSDKKQ